jgi:hypothetical protein
VEPYLINNYIVIANNIIFLYTIYPAPNPFEVKLQTRNKVTIFGNFSGTLSDVVPGELWENSYKSVHFLLTENRNNQRITV